MTDRRLVTAAILLSMFMSAMEATVVATAMPTVVADLRGIELYGWVGSLYMLAMAATIPLWGRAADLWGRRPVLLLGLALFALGSVACGTAGSMAALIAFRAIQGVGAGAMQPVSLTLVGDLYTLEERSRIQGVFGAVWGLAGMAGPLLGGLIVRALSWRWVFFVNVPFGVVSGALLVLFLKEPAREGGRPVRLDLAGAALLVASVVSLLVGVGGRAPLVTLPFALAAAAAFVWNERRAPDAILPPSLFGDPVVAVASVANVLMGSVMMTSLIYLPLYAQGLLGATPTEAGAAVAPMLIGWPLASALSGRVLTRVGFRTLVRVGLLVVGASTLALRLTLGAGGHATALKLVMFAFGAGMGFANTALMIAVQESVSWERRGIATASTVFFRTIGGTVSVGAFGALLSWRLAGRVPEGILRELLGAGHGRSLGAAVLHRVSGDLGAAILSVFTGVAALGLVAASAGLAFPRVEIASDRSERLANDPDDPMAAAAIKEIR